MSRVAVIPDENRRLGTTDKQGRPDPAADLAVLADRGLGKESSAGPALGYGREDFAEHIRTEHSTFRWLFEPMLGAAGFEIATADFGGSVYGAYTCIKT